MGKIIIEDWSAFNEAVHRRAYGGAVPPPTAAGAEAPVRYPLPAGPPRFPPLRPAPRFAVSPPPSWRGWTVWGLLRIVIAILLVIALIAYLSDHHGWQGLQSRLRDAAMLHAGQEAADTASSLPPSGKDAVVTNYTLFRSVAFRDGAVVTGWRFAHSGDATPDLQYCYFTRQRPFNNNILPDGSQVTTRLLGKRGLGTSGGRTGSDETEEVDYNIAARPGTRDYSLPDALSADFGTAGWKEAATKCSWFSQ